MARPYIDSSVSTIRIFRWNAVRSRAVLVSLSVCASDIGFDRTQYVTGIFNPSQVSWCFSPLSFGFRVRTRRGRGGVLRGGRATGIFESMPKGLFGLPVESKLTHDQSLGRPRDRSESARRNLRRRRVSQ